MADARTSSRINLSILQVVVLLGLISGGLLTCFYLGYYTGRKLGLEEALDTSLSASIKLPVQGKDVDKQSLTEVYEKLKEPKPAARKDEDKKDGQKSSAATVAAIDSVAQAPVAEVYKGSDSSQGSQDDLEAIRKALLGSSTPIPSKGVSVRELGATTAGAGAIETTAPDTTANKVKEAAPSKPSVAVSPIPNSALDEDVPTEPVHAVPTTRPTPRATPTAIPVKTKVPTPAPTPARRLFGDATESTTSNTSSGSGSQLRPGWYAQVAAPPTEEDAKQLVQRLRSSGFATAIERAEVRDQHYFRVLVGPEQSRDLGNRMLQELRRESYLKSEPFIRMVR